LQALQTLTNRVMSPAWISMSDSGLHIRYCYQDKHRTSRSDPLTAADHVD